MKLTERIKESMRETKESILGYLAIGWFLFWMGLAILIFLAVIKLAISIVF